MTRRYIPGGTSGELLPSGEYIVNVKQTGMQTHFGAVPFPLGESLGVLFPRCSIVGGFKCAGQRNSTVTKAAEYIRGQWVTRDDLPLPVTNWPVIYDHNGTLHCNPVGAAGSQGFRYVTPANEIVTGDQTYGPFFGLHEYTYLGDALWIGQASDAFAAVIYDGTVRRLLETGNRRFIVANRLEEIVTIAMTDPMGVILIQTTMDELRALPVFVPPSAPQPTPVPVPPPKPEPKPMPVDHRDLVTSLAAQFPFDRQSAASIFGFVRRIAWALKDEGCGLLLKPGGENIVTYQGQSYSLSRVCYPDGHIYKVLSDAGVGATNGPGWSDNGMVTPDLYHVALPPDDAGSTAPTPAPSDAGLAAKVAALERRIAALEAKPSGFPSKIALKANDGHYVCAEGGGGREVVVNRDSAGPWETFSVEPQP